MRHYRIIFLLLSSLLLSSCAWYKFASSGPTTPDKPPILKLVIPDSGAVKYKASIDFLNKHFTGIVVLKQTDPETKHLVFVTELGMRMFDFEMKADTIKPVYVFDPLNKPKLVSSLIRNFKAMLLIEWDNNGYSVRAKSNKEVLYLVEVKNKHFLKDRELFLFKDEKGYASSLHVFYKHKKESKTIYINNYSTIKLKQYGLVKLYIELEKITE